MLEKEEEDVVLFPDKDPWQDRDRVDSQTHKAAAGRRGDARQGNEFSLVSSSGTHPVPSVSVIFRHLLHAAC